MTRKPRATTQTVRWLTILPVTLAAAVLLALLSTGRLSSSPSTPTQSTPLAERSTTIDAASFLKTYLRDGRVVRRDQGGDTVSEGQGYGMLIALGAKDHSHFDQIWQWTRTHLQRDDGLISWRWDGDEVADPSSASDADLDIARALVLAGNTFHQASYTRAGERLGTAVLAHETLQTPAGLVLLAGQWATTAPYAFNPSYVSPVAARVLGRATGDPRWAQLETGSRAAVRALTQDDRLPPDWARIDSDGSVVPSPAPSGQSVRYGYDAARTLVRHAESCSTADRDLAGAAAEVVTRVSGSQVVALYDLAGSPQTHDVSPLVTIAQAAGASAVGDETLALRAIRTAGRQQRQTPTYYGDAWTVLGPMLLSDPALGGCPQLSGKV